jgi:multiple sugar transport system substrate-binding protein
MKKKEGLLVLLAALMVLAGCGKKEASATGPQKTTVTIWSHNRHDMDFMKRKVEEYNARNTDNIEVKLEIYTDNYTQAVDLAFQSGETPDIFSNNHIIYTNHFSSGRFLDFIPRMDESFKSLYGDLLFEGANYIDGKCYFIPTMASVNRLFYNKDIFRRVGAEPPQTLEEMVQVSKTITAQLKGEGIYGFAQNMRDTYLGLDRSLAPMGDRELGLHQGYDFARGEYDFTGYAPILEAWKQLLGPDSAFPGTESLDIDPLRAQFAAGKIAMYFSWTHAEPGVYQNQFPTTQDWGAVQIPVHDGMARGAQYINLSNGYLINAYPRDLEASWKVLTDLILDVGLLVEYYEAGLGVAVVPEVVRRANPARIYRENSVMLITGTDAVWPYTPHELNPAAVVVEGMDLYDTWAAIIWGALDTGKGLTDLTGRYNKAYRSGISQGIGKEVKIPGFNPMKPAMK